MMNELTLEEQLRHARARYSVLEADVVRMKVDHAEQIKKLEHELTKLRRLVLSEGMHIICDLCYEITPKDAIYHGCSGTEHQEVVLCSDCYEGHFMCDSCNNPICSECHFERLCESYIAIRDGH